MTQNESIEIFNQKDLQNKKDKLQGVKLTQGDNAKTNGSVAMLD